MTTFDYNWLNIQRDDGEWLCPSCGFSGYFDGTSFDASGPLVATGICPCCLYEPGFDDVSAASGCKFYSPIQALRDYSQKWREDGCRWRGSEDSKPDHWDPAGQLADWERLVPVEMK